MRTTTSMRARLIALLFESFKLPLQIRNHYLRLFSSDFPAFAQIGLNFSGIVARANARDSLGVVREPGFY
jgi:hypothetical protein